MGHMMNGEITIPPSSGLGKSVPPPGLFNLHKTHRQQQLKSFSPSLHLQSLWWLPRHPSWLYCLLQCQVLTTFHSPLLLQTKKAVLLSGRNGLVIFNVVRLALSQKKIIREGLRHGIAPIPLTFQYRLFSRRIEGLAWQPAQELWVTSSWPNQPDCLLQGRYPRVFTDRRSGSWELGLWNPFLELLSLVNSCNWALLNW